MLCGPISVRVGAAINAGAALTEMSSSDHPFVTPLASVVIRNLTSTCEEFVHAPR